MNTIQFQFGRSEISLSIKGVWACVFWWLFILLVVGTLVGLSVYPHLQTQDSPIRLNGKHGQIEVY